MKGLIQRVSEASVNVDGSVVGKINRGILLLLGVEKGDSQQEADRLLKKVLSYRIFDDESGKMNLSLMDAGGALLIVSQFTLVADTKKGLRPGFSSGATPVDGLKLYDYFVAQAKDLHPKVETGCYGADMKVSLINDGPVTFLLEC
ncbi:D-aminoacyl-tRNA deacylase [Alkalimarinus sediminis]|uniref:D-aminoacyl-tRNA deacylase n=1 Tax=Alkalimarinus sediminis TaxID=1632866 RepID=A0A9E8KPK6_9ALTE|nr:D-aminoacyl-tRNA deacylase [Alkalimarinus sediminis]UZW75458.1 D-aminoacyl-tRNA deacylase [Alkalimarinus sediminis]